MAFEQLVIFCLFLHFWVLAGKMFQGVFLFVVFPTIFVYGMRQLGNNLTFSEVHSEMLHYMPQLQIVVT